MLPLFLSNIDDKLPRLRLQHSYFNEDENCKQMILNQVYMLKKTKFFIVTTCVVAMQKRRKEEYAENEVKNCFF